MVLSFAFKIIRRRNVEIEDEPHSERSTFAVHDRRQISSDRNGCSNESLQRSQDGNINRCSIG